MDLSAFDSAIRALEVSLSNREASLDLLTYGLILCNVVVLIGLIVEFHEEAIEFGTGRPRTRRRWKLTFLGGVVVILGIAGELSITFKAHRVETKVRSDSHRIEGLLNTKAGSAADNAARASSEADSAKRRADDIAEKADELRRKTSKLATKLADAERAELAERKKVLDMEIWLSPRVLPINIASAEGNWPSLKPFAGTNAIIKCVMGEEPRRAAGQIAVILQQVGWNILGVVTIDLDLQAEDGVRVWAHVAAQATPEGSFEEELRSLHAARALADLLDDNGWDAMAHWGSSSTADPHWVPSNTVLVEVGLKPNPYISPNLPKSMQEAMTKRNELERQMKEWQRRVREWKKRGMEGPRPLPPSPAITPNPKREKN
jgi:hypothetical protein